MVRPLLCIDLSRTKDTLGPHPPKREANILMPIDPLRLIRQLIRPQILRPQQPLVRPARHFPKLIAAHLV